MIERNKTYISISKLENMIKTKYNLYDDIWEDNVTFEYILANKTEPANFVKVIEKTKIKELEFSREMEIDELDIEEIIRDYLNDTEYSFEAFAYDYDGKDVKTFKGIIVYLTKKQKKN